MRLEQAALKVYGTLARAFPAEFEQVYGAGMVDAAGDMVRGAAGRRGAWRLIVLLPRLLVDLALRLAVEHCRDFVRDAHYAARMLARSSGFTLAAVVCLALGIGLTAAIYTQMRSTVFRELPGVADPGALVRVQRPISFADYEEYRDAGGQFSSLAAFMGPVPVVISHQGAMPQRIWGHVATPDYFDVLGTKAAVGRVFGPEERTQGGAQAAVLSENLWRTRFGGDPSIVGRSIRINGQPVVVIGVAQRDFLGASPTTASADIWIPTTAQARVAPELARLRDRRLAAFTAIGRLKPGIEYAQAEQALETLARRLEQIHGDPGRDSKERRVQLLPGGRMFPMRDEDLPRAMGFPLLLVGLVLLMACGNVANMLLARSAARRREIAVRLSVGAGPGRIVRQLLTESLLLAVLGAAGGVLFALWYLSLMGSFRPILPGYVYFSARLEWQSLGFAVLVAAGSAVVFGLAPALRASRADVYAGLKSSEPPRLRARRWFSMRNVLVFQQVAVSVVLLLLTSFVVVGWQRSARVDVGFETANLYLVGLDPVRDGYTPERAQSFFDNLPERLRRVPGVMGASLAQTLPLAMSSGEMMMNAKIEFAGGAKSLAAMRADRVGENFFETVGAPLLRGRTFTERDETDDSRVLIVNETMAKRVWPGENPVGQPVDLEGKTWQVIGVVGDIRSAFPLAPAVPAVYRPVTPSGFAAPAMHGVTVAVRVASGFDAPTRLRREIEAIDSNVTVFRVTPMSDEVEQMLYVARFATFVYGGMGVFGLVLACVGLAGVTAYAVARRTHEIGIRMALGASRASVLGLVLREGGVIIVAGTVVGMAVALAAARALASFVEALAETTRTSVSDPLLVIGGPGLLVALALAACYLPARRSTRIDPVTALRSE